MAFISGLTQSLPLMPCLRADKSSCRVMHTQIKIGKRPVTKHGWEGSVRDARSCWEQGQVKWSEEERKGDVGAYGGIRSGLAVCRLPNELIEINQRCSCQEKIEDQSRLRINIFEIWRSWRDKARWIANMELSGAFCSFLSRKQLQSPSIRERNEMPGEFAIPAPAASMCPHSSETHCEVSCLEGWRTMFTEGWWQEMWRWSLEAIIQAE